MSSARHGLADPELHFFKRKAILAHTSLLRPNRLDAGIMQHMIVIHAGARW